VLEILFYPIVVMISIPGGALIPPAVFTVLYFMRRTKIARFGRIILISVIIFWTVYGVYETYMYYWMKTVIAPIRVDLLIITPILYLLAIVFIIVLIKIPRVKNY